MALDYSAVRTQSIGCDLLDWPTLNFAAFHKPLVPFAVNGNAVLGVIFHAAPPVLCSRRRLAHSIE